MLAKLPHHENGSTNFSTGAFLASFFALGIVPCTEVESSVDDVDRRGYLWTTEGYLIQDFFAASGGGPVYADKQLVVTRTRMPEGLRFAGEIDISNSSAVAESLKIAFPRTGDAHLDVSRLSFCDISGIRAIVDTARDLGDGRKVLLHGLPEQLETVMRVTGWSSLPSLALCSCGGDGLL